VSKGRYLSEVVRATRAEQRSNLLVRLKQVDASEAGWKQLVGNVDEVPEPSRRDAPAVISTAATWRTLSISECTARAPPRISMSSSVPAAMPSFIEGSVREGLSHSPVLRCPPSRLRRFRPSWRRGPPRPRCAPARGSVGKKRSKARQDEEKRKAPRRGAGFRSGPFGPDWQSRRRVEETK
jgi:hypothetical protein